MKRFGKIPPTGYFQKIRSVLEKYDVLLVSDEVICGFGRTGNMWGAQTMDMRPDILTCAKALSSAYLPISAVMISDKIYAPLAEQAEKLGIFGHGYTYSAHPVCAAVALRAQKLMQERDVIGHVRSIMPTFAGHVASMDKYDFIGNVRSIGLIGQWNLPLAKTITKNLINHIKLLQRHSLSFKNMA